MRFPKNLEVELHLTRLLSGQQAFNLLAAGSISSGFTASITTALSAFYPDNLNNGHLEYFYYVSAMGAVIAIPLYLFFATQFQYKNYNDDTEIDTIEVDNSGQKSDLSHPQQSTLTLGDRRVSSAERRISTTHI